MTFNFLYLVNRLCHKLNEVELTSTTFSSAVGVYQDFKESVNAAISDIYQQELNAWPFSYVNTTFNTVIGQGAYNPVGAATVVDWDSFYIKKQPRTPSSITNTGTTATVTDVGHPHQTGDTIYITGATQTGYNGYLTVTVLSSSQFTYTVPAGTVTPATGTIFIYPQYTTAQLTQIDYDTYLKEGYLLADGECIQIGQYSKPVVIVRKPDNTFILSGVPDRIYTISYDYSISESDLNLYSDVPLVPEAFKQTIVDGAMYHAYMFRDNEQEAADAAAKFKNGVDQMRRLLIPQQYYMRVDPSIAN